jgi:polyphosphate kinase 2
MSKKSGGARSGKLVAQKLARKDYEAALEPMQLELAQMSRWLAHHHKRLLIIFEGRDTAGKSGIIRAISEVLDPRRCQVVALGKPSEQERSQWYFQRYVPHLPSAGNVVLFDRSWYNRAGVEKVMGFCTDEEYRRFMREVPLFERMLIDDGIILFKYWLCVDQAEQEERFAERLADPLKRWKLSPIDVVARTKYAEYGRARNTMIKATHTEHAPWTLVDFNDQRLGRLTLIRHLLDHLPDQQVPEQTIDMPALEGRPGKESYPAGHAPLPAHPVNSA